MRIIRLRFLLISKEAKLANAPELERRVRELEALVQKLMRDTSVGRFSRSQSIAPIRETAFRHRIIKAKGSEINMKQYVIKEQLFTANGTWTNPSSDETEVFVDLVGGGGGGAGGGSTGGVANGGDGAASTFGTLATANGGTGGNHTAGTPGTGYNGGQRGESAIAGLLAQGGIGGYGPMGFGHGGAGGNASAVNVPAGSGGGSGQVAFYMGNVSGNQTITVGAGGVAGAFGTNGYSGNVGSSGMVLVKWVEEI